MQRVVTAARSLASDRSRLSGMLSGDAGRYPALQTAAEDYWPPTHIGAARPPRDRKHHHPAVLPQAPNAAAAQRGPKSCARAPTLLLPLPALRTHWLHASESIARLYGLISIGGRS
eukprot:4040054-Prymnesium_polylepis.1